MCGITGFTGLEDKAVAKRMNASLAHRGPDQDGFYFDSEVVLGNRRLKIIDLSESGRQPIHNEDETVWVTFNGEIYNFKALRTELERKGHKFYSKTDTEVMVHGFEEWGVELPSKLRGDFAFAVWDSEKKKLFLARDPLGVNPLYYSFYETGKGRGIAFASEIKALLFHPQVKRQVDLQALNEYVSLRYSLGPRTLFAGISKLQPGTSLEFDAKSGSHKLRTYWDFSFKPARESEQFFVEKIRSLLSESVKLRLMSDVPLGAYLSGGLDSSFLVALMAHAVKEEGASNASVNTFSVSFNQPTDETRYARLVAEKYSTNHKELAVDTSKALKVLPLAAWHLDEPIADAAAIPTYLMSRATKPFATVVLTGDGGDELFGGYARYTRLPRIHRLSAVAKRARHLAFVSRLSSTKEVSRRLKETLKGAGSRANLFISYASAFSEEEKKVLYSEKLEEELEGGSSIEEGLQPFFAGKTSYADELFNFDIKTLLPDDYLMKVNKMSMANSVESRVPYLDQVFVEFAATIPHELKVSGSHTKKIMRKAMQGFVPQEIIERKKWGFNVPTKTWLGGELGEVAEQMLSDAAVRRRGYFNSGAVQSVLRNYATNESYYSRQFWALFALELWHRIFIDPQEGEIGAPASLRELV